MSIERRRDNGRTVAGASGQVLLDAPYVGSQIQDFDVKTVLKNRDGMISAIGIMKRCPLLDARLARRDAETHVDLLHLCPQLGYILLDSRSRAQSLELLLDGFYTLQVVGHLHRGAMVSYDRSVRERDRRGSPCWCCLANPQHCLAAKNWRACIPGGGSTRRMRRPRRIRRTVIEG